VEKENMNNDIVPGFDDEPTNEHIRKWHDCSLDHPKIVLERVVGLPECLILRLCGPLMEVSQGFFSERIMRPMKAGFRQYVFDCTMLDKDKPRYWFHLAESIQLMAYIFPVVLIGIEENNQTWVADWIGDSAKISERGVLFPSDTLQALLNIKRYVEENGDNR
jgi:hypothetical protein